MPKNPTLIEPIDTSFNNLTKATVMTSNKVAAPEPFDRKALRDKTKGIVPKNGRLSFPLFHSEIHIENQEIEMGILESGIPYLSQRGLVKMAGIGRTSLLEPKKYIKEFVNSIKKKSENINLSNQ